MNKWACHNEAAINTLTKKKEINLVYMLIHKPVFY